MKLTSLLLVFLTMFSLVTAFNSCTANQDVQNPSEEITENFENESKDAVTDKKTKETDDLKLTDEVGAIEFSLLSNGTYAVKKLLDTNATEISIPDKFNDKAVTKILRNAFKGATKLTSVVIPNSINEIVEGAFSGCAALKNVTINENIAEFSYGCFNNCSSLTNLDFVTNGVLLQPYAFNGTGAESVVLSDSLLAIPDYAFTNCPNLKYVTIPKSVIFIQPNAFDFEDVTVRCFYDSYVYHYALEQELPYELCDGVKLGDANADGSVNINDVTAIQRHIAEMETLAGINLYVSDIDRNQTRDISDATLLQRYLAEFEVPYPVGTVLKQ